MFVSKKMTSIAGMPQSLTTLIVLVNDIIVDMHDYFDRVLYLYNIVIFLEMNIKMLPDLCLLFLRLNPQEQRETAARCCIDFQLLWFLSSCSV